MALTFDDGPGGSTAAILAVLTRYKVPATFFNIGVNMAARPSLVRVEARDGYVLGDHTWDHPDLVLLSAAGQAAELDRVSAEQWSLTRTVPCVFRPPGGDYDATTLRLAQQRRMGVWLWSVDTQDWLADGSGSSSSWVQRIIRLAEAEGAQLRHPVVLMHNQPIGNPATVSALPADHPVLPLTWLQVRRALAIPASCGPGGHAGGTKGSTGRPGRGVAWVSGGEDHARSDEA